MYGTLLMELVLLGCILGSCYSAWERSFTYTQYLNCAAAMRESSHCGNTIHIAPVFGALGVECRRFSMNTTCDFE